MEKHYRDEIRAILKAAKKTNNFDLWVEGAIDHVLFIAKAISEQPDTAKKSQKSFLSGLKAPIYDRGYQGVYAECEMNVATHQAIKQDVDSPGPIIYLKQVTSCNLSPEFKGWIYKRCECKEDHGFNHVICSECSLPKIHNTIK